MLTGPARQDLALGRSAAGFALERSLGRASSWSATSSATRGVMVATVKPDIARRGAGMNVQLALELPRRRLGRAASSRSATACACGWSPPAPMDRESKPAWSKPAG